jgi:hypothetical protein
MDEKSSLDESYGYAPRSLFVAVTAAFALVMTAVTIAMIVVAA